MRMLPVARKMLPRIPHTRGPYRSRMAPTGRADMLVVIDARVKKKFSLGRSARF